METARARAFIESAEAGSFKLAGDHLGYTPSGVSQLVTALENDLGIRLLIRSKRGVELTVEGRKILPAAKAFVRREEDLYHLASELRGLTTGTLSIASYPSIATSWLPGVVRQFQAEYPGIQINIMEGIRSEIFGHIDNQDVDMGFLIYTEPMNYEWIPLADDELIAVLPENHRLANADAYPVEECLNDKVIMTSWGDDPDIEEIFKRNNVYPEIRLTTYDCPVALAMIQMGIGMSFMNRLSTSRWNDHLVKLPLEPRHKITFGIAIKSYDHLSSAAQKFLEATVRYLTKAEGDDSGNSFAIK